MQIRIETKEREKMQQTVFLRRSRRVGTMNAKEKEKSLKARIKKDPLNPRRAFKYSQS